MKLFIASDIHGSAYYCGKMIEAFKREGADRMLLLGDILYHGPRNDLPKGYAPKEVIGMLNDLGNKITCVRGNCDAEVDQMVLSFPVMSDYVMLDVGGTLLFATHGHVYGKDNLPKQGGKYVLLCGHTHVPACEEISDAVYINPGSVSIPKENSENGYIVFENGVFVWKNLGGEEYKSYSAKK